MTGVGGDPRTQAEFVVDTRKRLVSLERQLSQRGAVDLSKRLVAGKNITIDGVGSLANPMVISSSGGGGAPALPAPQAVARPSASFVDWTASTWQDVSGISALTLTPDHDLWVSVNFTAMLIASTGYTAVGVKLSGGVTAIPPADPLSGDGSAWGQAPFGFATNYQAVSGHKVFMIPGGVTTTFTMQALRSVGSGTQGVNYPIMQVVPLYWDGAPGGTTAGVDWGDISNKPSTFPPSAHTHPISQVIDLQDDLDGKAALVHTHTSSQITDFSTAVPAAVPAATTTVQGKVELATSTEATTGTDTTRAVTPAGLKAVGDTKAPLSHTHTASQVTDFSTAVPAAVPSATETVQGKVELATNAETQTGSDATRAVTPASLSSRTATETRTGIVELATVAEAQAGTDAVRVLTPATLQEVTASNTRRGIAEIATQAEVLAGTDAGRIVSPLALAGLLDALPSMGRAFLFGDSTRNYRIVAGVIRNSGSGWEFINDANHRPTGMASVSQDATSIEIDFSFTGTRVAGVVVCPDEGLAGKIHIGPSVGLGDMTLYLRRLESMADYIWYDSGLASWRNLNGLMDVTSFPSSGLVIEHDDVFSSTTGGGNPYAVSVTGRAGASQSYIYKIGSGGVGVDFLTVEVRSAGGTAITTPNDNMRFFVDRGPYWKQLNPADVNTTEYPGSNIWIFGVLEV